MEIRSLTLLLATFSLAAQESPYCKSDCNQKSSLFSYFPEGIPPGVNDTRDATATYINASYILWTARQEGMAIAASNTTINTPISTDSAIQGEIVYPNWKLTSGFKAAIGTYLGHDGWDLGLQFIWFASRHNNYSTLTQGALFPTWLLGTFLTDVNTAQSRWNNFFYRLDGKIARDFYLGRTLTVKPFIGLIGAIEKQWFDIAYTYNVNPLLPLAITDKNRQKWWGFGPYLGSNNSFICYQRGPSAYSLFLNSGVALAWGNYKTAYDLESETPLLPPTDIFINIKNSYWNLTPLLELALGIRLETSHTACDKWSSLLQVAWESQLWFGHNQMALLNRMHDGNNYSMQGLTVTAQISF
jgi:hypothetical protein